MWNIQYIILYQQNSVYINFKCVIDNNIIFISHRSLTLYFYINLFPPCDEAVIYSEKRLLYIISQTFIVENGGKTSILLQLSSHPNAEWSVVEAVPQTYALCIHGLLS